MAKITPHFRKLESAFCLATIVLLFIKNTFPSLFPEYLPLSARLCGRSTFRRRRKPLSCKLKAQILWRKRRGWNRKERVVVEMTGCDVKYRDWLKEWLVRIKGGVRESTWANYSVAVMNHIPPVLGECTLEEIDRGKAAGNGAVLAAAWPSRREWRPVRKNGGRSGQHRERQPARGTQALTPSPQNIPCAIPARRCRGSMC